MSHTNLTYPYKLPDLGFALDALEPAIDAQTMEIHHGKHHGGYVKKLNAALEEYPRLQKYDLHHILSNIESLPADIQTAVRNNGGGHLNHSLFWQILKPGGRRELQGEFRTALEKKFGAISDFKAKFGQVAMSRFGSGWAWLVLNAVGELHLYSTPNQDSPLMDGMTPLLGLDVWEHAYYLKYQNRRNEYVENFWSVVNWGMVEEFYTQHRADRR